KQIKNLKKTIKIFIDPGHGGYDPGASSNGLVEKNLNLIIAKEIERRLKQYVDIEIMLARNTDEHLELAERTKMANDWGADYFFSVHINAGGGAGIESYIHNTNSTADEKTKQTIIHETIVKGLGSSVRDRGQKQANFHVLRESNMS